MEWSYINQNCKIHEIERKDVNTSTLIMIIIFFTLIHCISFNEVSMKGAKRKCINHIWLSRKKVLFECFTRKEQERKERCCWNAAFRTQINYILPECGAAVICIMILWYFLPYLRKCFLRSPVREICFRFEYFIKRSVFVLLPIHKVLKWVNHAIQYWHWTHSNTHFLLQIFSYFVLRMSCFSTK